MRQTLNSSQTSWAALGSICLLGLASLSCLPLAAQEGEALAFAPVKRMHIKPLPDDRVSPSPPSGLAEGQIVLPEPRPVDEETWNSLKANAAFDPRAERGAIVAFPSISAATGLSAVPLFPGLGYQQLTPPDTTLAKSTSRILQAINSQIWLFDAAGNLLAGRTLANFLATNALPIPPFDPKVLYDRNAVNPRLFVVASQYDFQPPAHSSVFLAVSRSANPSNLDPVSWCVYWLSTTDDFGTTAPTFADQPHIGAGAEALILATNQFTISSPQTFTFANIYAFDKVGLENNATQCPTGIATIFRPASSAGDFTTFALQPALHYSSPSSFTGTTNPAYLMSNYFPSGSIYRLWRIRNLLAGASPGQLQVVKVSGASYSIPPDAPQAGTSIQLDVDDARVSQAAGVGNALWATHSTVCNLGGVANVSCARVLRFDVGQDSAGNPTAVISQQPTFGGGANVYYWMPGIAVNQALRTVVPFLFSSASLHLSAGWTAKDAGISSYPAAQTLGSGTCISGLSSPIDRTGDYVGAQTDPNNFTSFWISGEHAAVYPPPPSGNICTWLTDILQVN